MNPILKVITWKIRSFEWFFSIRYFDSMGHRSFHTPSRYDFRSNVIRPDQYLWNYLHTGVYD